MPESPKNLSINKFRDIIKSKNRRILKTHSFGDFSNFDKFAPAISFLNEEIIPNAKIINVHRDGRDVLNSLFHYMIAKGVTYNSFSEFLRSGNSSDNVHTDLSRVEFLNEHKKSWRGVDNTLSVGYEDMKTDFVKTINNISGFLGLELKSEPAMIRLKKYSKVSRGIRRIFPRFFNSTAILPRSGISGEWRESFSENDLKYYELIMMKKK